jgi:hypothetical protein
MGEAWCPRCARPVATATTTPPVAWLAGGLGCVGTLALLLAGWFVVLFVGLTAGQATPDDAYATAYALTSSVGLLAPTVAALIIGGIALHATRRRVCPICRTRVVR